ncbi:MAG TPA: YbdK family carboxylate-amine ligase [Kineosporiaceae bacterium]|nr:YbdK family carboxylate-amine ligase [Kineosporiaceae bacterium]
MREPDRARIPPAIHVDEQYLLLDPRTATPVGVAPDVLHEAARTELCPPAPGFGPLPVPAQVELSTPGCTELADLHAQVRRGRAVLAESARSASCLLAPLGSTPVEPDQALAAEDGNGRRQPFHERRLFQDSPPLLVDEQLVNGLHVHVEVPDRDAAVSVMNRLRPWLHVLLGLSANSPLWCGRDSGFASWRAVHTQWWAVEGTPPDFRSAVDYERRVDALIASGALPDQARLHWSMRLSQRHPAVEVRVTDAQLDVDSTVMLAALVRALVMAALDQIAEGVHEPAVPAELLRAATWQAARHGVSAELVDLVPGRGRRRPGGPPSRLPAPEVVAHLLAQVEPVAAQAELDQVLPTVAATLLGAGGAARQRRAIRRGGLPALLDLLARYTCERTCDRMSTAAPLIGSRGSADGRRAGGGPTGGRTGGRRTVGRRSAERCRPPLVALDYGSRAVVARCRGELDLAAAPELEAGLLDALALLEVITLSVVEPAPGEGGPEDRHALVVDLSGVTFLDCAAFQVLVAASQRCAGLGRRFVVTGTPGPVRRLLRVVGVVGADFWFEVAPGPRPQPLGWRPLS